MCRRSRGSSATGCARRGDRLELWTFQANHGALRFYVREGFTEGQRTDCANDEGLADVNLVWERPD